MDQGQISEFLTMILLILGAVCLIFFVILIWLNIKIKKGNSMQSKEETVEVAKPLSGNKEYSKASIYDFMEFEDIKDNMIIKKNRMNYLMVIGCQGINYDLMSGIEKNSTEQGFLQFLNTLRYPIQLYIQTRSVNLNNSLQSYNKKIEEIKREYLNKQMTYNAILNSDKHSEKDKANAKKEFIKARNLYEYGLDVYKNTEKMNLNKNILNKQYYIIISFVPEEIDKEGFSDEELRNRAFSDLYTKATSMIGLLGVTGIKGKVLNSRELAELLYISYNRDDSELLDLNRALNSGYMEIYSTAKDVIEKRKIEIENEINEEARLKAESATSEAFSNIELRRELAEKEKIMDDLIDEMANSLIDESAENLGEEIVKESKEILKKETSTKRGRRKKVDE